MKDRVQIVALAIGGVALVLGLLPARPSSRTYWITIRPLALGQKLDPRDFEAVGLTGNLPQGALPGVGGAPVGYATRALSPSQLVVATDISPSPPPQKSHSSLLAVSIPVDSLGPGMRVGASALILAVGSGPPSIIAVRAPIIGVGTSSGGTTVTVSLPLPEVEAVELALSQGKVAVVPWTD